MAGAFLNTVVDNPLLGALFGNASEISGLHGNNQNRLDMNDPENQKATDTTLVEVDPGSKKPTSNEAFLTVPVIMQLPELPTGCEAVSVTMLLNYAGVEITKSQVAEEMPRANDPHLGYLGDPFTYYGGTIYPEPFEGLITGYVGSYQNLTGVSIEKIRALLMDGKPVVAWISEEYGSEHRGFDEWYELGSFFGFSSYHAGQYYTDATTGNRYFLASDSKIWRNFLHCLCLTGFDETVIYFNDPLFGERTLDYNTFLYLWSCSDYMALSY